MVGMGKWISTFAVLLIAGVVVLFLVFYLSSRLPDLPLPEEHGERNRFIRYMACAGARCSRGCWSPEVLDIALEYKDGVVIRGCNDDCGSNGEIRCGEDNAFEFIFNDDVFLKGYPKPDASRRFLTSGMIPNPCTGCWGSEPWQIWCTPYFWGLPESMLPGQIHSNTDCEKATIGDYSREFISIWTSNDFASNEANCEGEQDKGSYSSWDNCTFSEGTRIKIWADPWNVHGSEGWLGTEETHIDYCFCQGDLYNCPEIVICD